MLKIARTGERPAEHLRLYWEAPDEADEQAFASEAVTALFSFTDSWLEPLALELRLGCYDREILTECLAESYARLEQPFHLLVREPRLPHVEIDPWYRVVESGAPFLERNSVQSWLVPLLAQSCGDPERYRTSLREIMVRASRTRLPPGWADTESLMLECYTGTIRARVALSDGASWIEAPALRYGLPLPIELRMINWDGVLELRIHVYWSPWVGEHARPRSRLADGIARLAARGWSLDSEES